MATAIRVDMLPARMGDCLLVECERDGERPWRMLVDGGPPDTWPALEERLSKLADPHLDVVVITHIDNDHIGGMLPFLDSPFAADVGDVWFNGRTHLPDTIGTRSVAQGESVSAMLRGTAGGTQLPWNVAFDGGPIDTGAEAGFIEVETAGPRITLLSPTTKRLGSLAKVWDRALDEARRDDDGPTPADHPAPLTDIAALATARTSNDTSSPNGSSIAMLLEHRGASIVLGADAYGTVLGAGLAGLAAGRGLDALEVDAFKLPHHGSRANVLTAMLGKAPARHYLVSSNGDTYHHPDDEALARVVTRSPGVSLWFNYRNARTERWDDASLQGEYDYTTHYPETDLGGITLELPER